MKFLEILRDPYGFEDALAGLGLTPDDLPGITREGRLAGLNA